MTATVVEPMTAATTATTMGRRAEVGGRVHSYVTVPCGTMNWMTMPPVKRRTATVVAVGTTETAVDLSCQVGETPPAPTGTVVSPVPEAAG